MIQKIMRENPEKFQKEEIKKLLNIYIGDQTSDLSFLINCFYENYENIFEEYQTTLIKNEKNINVLLNYYHILSFKNSESLNTNYLESVLINSLSTNEIVLIERTLKVVEILINITLNNNHIFPLKFLNFIFKFKNLFYDDDNLIKKLIYLHGIIGYDLDIIDENDENFIILLKNYSFFLKNFKNHSFGFLFFLI
jgi:hypothetical protein